MDRPAKNPRLADGWHHVPGPGTSSSHGGNVPEHRERQSQYVLRDDDDDDNDADFEGLLAGHEHPQWNNFFHPLHHDDVRGSARPRPPMATKRKRTHHNGSDFGHVNPALDLPAWIGDSFPEYFARIPSQPELVDPDKENPYAADVELIHPALKRLPVPVQQTQQPIVVNSFIKARFPVFSPERKPMLSSVPLRHCLPNSLRKDPVGQPQHSGPLESVPNLPSNFGHIAKFNRLDGELFLFFRRAICDGRTLITDENTYLQQIMPIAEKSACVKHATLSLSASYVLDYKRSEMLEQRANYHHQKAVTLLDKELKNRHNFRPGKEEALIAALIILTHTESVSWDSVDGVEHTPKWHLATKLAERILDTSDPAYNYHSPNNVQFSRARPELANIICLDNVLSDCVYPLDPNNSKCRYPWLLRGTQREQRRVISFTGFSSLLMHYFVKITHLSARRQKYPGSPFILSVGNAIEEVLANFCQWSGLSEGYENAEALFDSCEVDEHGKVSTREKVTELIAESYVAAAQIYLQCRLFRRRRNDPVVQTLVHKLLRTIEMQPTSGPLFTAQTPLFSIFIAGIVASRPEHRDLIRNWFIPVCADSRGNVPPTWAAMQRIWEWVDGFDETHPYKEDTGAGAGAGASARSDEEAGSPDQEEAWWEELVGKISVDYGRMNLA